MKNVLILSGGLDSTVLLYTLLSMGKEVYTLSIDYGQRHRKELMAADGITRRLDIPHRCVDLRTLQPVLGGSSQTDPSLAVPEGAYDDPSMKVTVVPNRNMIMLAVAAGYAISLGGDTVYYAAHAGDHAIYPDCRPEFAAEMNRVLGLCHFYPVHLECPFINYSKAEIVRLGHRLGVSFHATWSCYKGGTTPCGICGTCQERIMAFDANNLEDPSDYGRPWAEVVRRAQELARKPVEGENS